MYKYHRNSHIPDGGIETFPRVDNGFVYQPFGYMMNLNHLMPTVKRNCKKILLPAVSPPSHKRQNRFGASYLNCLFHGTVPV
jgi:hypothetical protein